ncbi:hypothetical protein T484DRAFT_1951250 [Baffinella frigidus]|nr:hypothetical protein T484DRAFT_1951250 [Cryptophyta sp. CCMP2293]
MRLGAPLLLVLHSAVPHASAFHTGGLYPQASASRAAASARLIRGRLQLPDPGATGSRSAHRSLFLAGSFRQAGPRSATYRGTQSFFAMSASEGGSEGAKPAVHCKEPGDFESFVAALPDRDWALITIDGAAAVAGDAGGAVGPGGGDVFDAGRFHAELRTKALGRVLLHGERMESTQEFLNDRLLSCPAGVVCIADVQSKGKGRGGNVWESPAGCLLFSFTTRVSRAGGGPFYQYLVSIAVHRAVSELCGEDAKAAFELQLKWPNDIYAGNLKVGGVLCQTSSGGPSSSPGFQVVGGVGFNACNSAPTTCVRDLMESHRAGAGAKVTREALLAAFCNHFEGMLETMEEHGFAPFEETYLQLWMHSRQEVQAQVEDKGSPPVDVTIRGITSSGFLRAEDNSGRAFELHPDGNSLDMMQGLLYTKR